MRLTRLDDMSNASKCHNQICGDISEAGIVFPGYLNSPYSYRTGLKAELNVFSPFALNLMIRLLVSRFTQFKFSN